MPPITATPTEYVEAMPRMLGYVPHDSLVIANMPTADTRPADGSVSMMRLDLPTCTADVEAVMVALASTYLRHGHPGFVGWQNVMLLVWDERGSSNVHTVAAIRRIMRATRQDTPYTVLAVLTATADSVLGHCRTVDGETVPVHTPRAKRTSTLEAQLTLRGLQALPDRDAVAATVAGGANAAALPAVEVDRHTLAQIWRRAAAADDLSAEQTAQLVNGVNNLSLRDEALTSITAFFGDRSGVAPLGGKVLTDDQLAHLLDNLTRCCRAYGDDPRLADLLALTCFTAWMLGQGTVASVALERAQHVNPGHRLTRLLDTALSQGIRPPR